MQLSERWHVLLHLLTELLRSVFTDTAASAHSSCFKCDPACTTVHVIADSHTLIIAKRSPYCKSGYCCCNWTDKMRVAVRCNSVAVVVYLQHYSTCLAVLACTSLLVLTMMLAMMHTGFRCSLHYCCRTLEHGGCTQ